MLANGHTIIQMMEQLAPKHYAVPDDRIGLQIGSLNRPIQRVMVTLEVTNDVVLEAIDANVDLIIAHHAVIFRPLKHLQTDTPAGNLLEKLIKHDIAVYISHTNLDVAEGGINDLMAEALELSHCVCLEDVHTEALFKLAVFVPLSHHEDVLQAVLDAGAGSIGEYSHCSFNTEGFGTFLPKEGAHPFIGSPGVHERTSEMRIETVVTASLKRRVIQAMLKAHPYEEVAYDLYPMDLKGRTFGLGRVGRLKEPIELKQFAEIVKERFNVPSVRIVGNLERSIQKVAVLGGSGSSYVKKALFHGADVFVTGDIDYHTAQDALAAGIALIDPGHHAEKIMKQHVASWLTQELSGSRYQTEVMVSKVNTDPFHAL